MSAARESHSLTKVYYRPIEAAIRWSELTEYEGQILRTLKTRMRFGPHDFPEWPHLRLNTERIYDGIINNELPHGIDGVTAHRRSKVRNEDAHLTVRHVDLKMWMTRYYPDQRPDFLFGPLERELLPPTITVEALIALTLERSALRTRVRQLTQENGRLNADMARLRAEKPATARAHSQSHENGELIRSDRSETTYLNIIGGLLDALLGQSPSGQRYSSFTSQDAVISTIVAVHGSKLGISKRTLELKFAAARRTLTGN